MSALVGRIEALSQYGDGAAFLHQTAFRTFRWSYVDLYERVQKTATLLMHLGVGRGDAVVIWAPNSPEWATLFLACLYRGAVAVPADLGATQEFVRRIAEETDARLVAHSRYRIPPPLKAQVLTLEDLLDDIASCAPQSTLADVAEEETAQILYTSGTTGAPKGVILTHRNLAANIRSMDQAIRIGPDHLLVSLLPLSHVFEQSVTLWAALTHGATVVYLQVLKPSELQRALHAHPVTVLAVVPDVLALLANRIERTAGGGLRRSAFHAMLSAAEGLPWEARRRLFSPVHAQIGRSFRFFVSGGAALDPDLERFWDRMGFLVLQGYGLTEASPVVSVNREDARKIGSVGKPVPGVQVRIAEDGEVLVHGENVTPGYFRDPVRTAEAIRDGWLHTGDLGVLDADGFLFLRGRKKDLIVTGAGLNVYPEDVEAAFRKVPGVRDVVVLEHHGRVHAALLLEPGVDAGAVVAQGNQGLADYQCVRSYTVWQDADFPRTTTRKPKKHEVLNTLRRIEQGERPAVDGRREAQPATQVVAAIAEVSGRPPSELTSGATLGALGMDSVMRIALVGHLEERLNADVAEEVLTDETTVREVEELVRRGEAEPQRAFARWALAPEACGARRLLRRRLIFPAFDWLVRQRVEGIEHLEGLRPPVVFAPNHVSHLDTLAVWHSLPPTFQHRLAVAEAADFFEAPSNRPDLKAVKGLLFLVLTVGVNVFPLPRTGGFRQSLRYTGELLDHGWNILIFPEGRLSPSGEVEPFKEGIGVIAGEMRVPVVPVYIQGLHEVWPPGTSRPQRRGSAEVRFGEPLVFCKETYAGFTRRLEEAVRRLAA